MKICKEDVGRKVISDENKIGKIVDFEKDCNDGLPVCVEFEHDPANAWWFNQKGIESDELITIKFFNEKTEPKHYKKTPDVDETIASWGLDFREGNVVKYIVRYKDKGQSREDLEKLKWYVDRILASLDAEDTEDTK